MSDPVGSMGLPSKTGMPDLELIYRGGDNFLQRMQALSKLRDDQETAFVNLKLGNDAKAAHAHAVELRDEASRLRDEAQQVLNGANTDAPAIVQAAVTEAERVKAESENASRELQSAAAAVKREADAYASKTKSRSDAMVLEAQQSKQQLEAKRSELETAHKRAAAAESASISAAQAADQTRKTFETKIARLHEVIAEITGG